MKPFVRVRDRSTGHHYSVRNPRPDAHVVLKQPGADRFGRPFPAKPRAKLPAASTPNVQPEGLDAPTQEETP